MTGFYILNKCAEYLFYPYAIEIADYLKDLATKPLSEWKMPTGFSCRDVEE
mgnify:CR=1 FL=1